MILEKESPQAPDEREGAESYQGSPKPDVTNSAAPLVDGQPASSENENIGAVDFLRLLYPSGPWTLTSIAVDKKGIETRTFGPASEDEARAWLQRWNDVRNCYCSINPPIGDVTKKAERQDIKSVNYLHVDLDARAGEPLGEELDRLHHLLTDRLPRGVPHPTGIWSSGGGYWAVWKLNDPIPIDGDPAKAEDAKRYNQALERLFGADNCHNIDRIARLPGTWNIPDEKKLKKGRTRALARLVEWHPDRVYGLECFTAAPVERGSAGSAVEFHRGSQRARLHDVNELDQYDVPDRVKVICVQGRDPDNPKEGDNSRSIWVLDALCQLVRCGVPDQVMFSILMDSGFGISESILDKGGSAEKYAIRQIERAKEHAADFERCEKGKIIPNKQRNIVVAMARLGVTVRRDEFQDRLLIAGLSGVGPLLDDAAMTRLWLTVEERFQFRPSKEFFWDVVEDRARRDSFHPVRDYLDGLTWDGTGRLDRWLTTYGGAEDIPFTRAAGALFLVAAVRRVRQPGSKFDEMLVLESGQGADKSSALAALAVQEDWFSDDLPLNADGKRVIEALAGRWIVEAAELNGMRKGAVEGLKAFLSRRVDRARMSYDRLVSEVPRQCVIAGTTNSTQYLRDGTGNRRFWPVRVRPFDIPALRRDRDQLWAEAAAREASGVSIRLEPALYGAAAVEQDARRVDDPFAARLLAVLGDLTGKIKSVDVWTIVDVPSGQQTQEQNARLGDAMRELGWEHGKLRFGGSNPEYCYSRGTPDERRKRVVVSMYAGEVSADHELVAGPF